MNQRLIPVALEPRACLAETDETGRLILRTQSQTPTTTRDILAGVLGRDKESIRVLVGDIGGGFGQKTNLYPEEALAAFATTKLGKPVRWRADRIEEFLGGTHGRDLATRAELALDAQGRILAFRTSSLGNTGLRHGRRRAHSARAVALRGERDLTFPPCISKSRRS